MEVINSKIKICGEYINANAKIDCECLVCGNFWSSRPSDLLKGKGCRLCSIELTRNRVTMKEHVYLDKLKQKHPNIIMVSEYTKATDILDFKCNVCNYEWSQHGTEVLNIVGCVNCRGLNKTKEDYKREIESLGKVKLLEPYVNSNTKILVQCTNCGDQYRAIGYLLRKGSGCKKCADKERGNKCRKNQEHFIEELKTINDTILPCDQYINANTKIRFKCLKCEHIWEATPTSILRGNGCPNCAIIRKRMTKEEFLNKANSIGNDVDILSNYIDTSTPISVKCNLCSYIWETIPYKLLISGGCEKCTKGNRMKSTQEYIEELKKKEIIYFPLEEYKGTNTPISHKCPICETTWSVKPSHVLNYHGCPRCKNSSLEILTDKYLTNHNIYFINNYKYNNLFGIRGGKLSYDFYLPEYNALIECQGMQHEKPVEYFGGEKKFATQQEHDRRKREYAKQHNINLLEIWYYENVEEKLDKYFNNLNTNLNLESVETVIPI